ncbi:hypothetical protein K7711_40145 [Nocardia sp. CA2R105]|uniref:hypothetical protein n=1 Tax=Nocardia coffeae TaxID=2873381 RepID=UPI001CA690F3|nr:hypothetical protein [Nocardia coffeae]MBY8862736.1 hypothetical protein [Nocardia coffeae]
MTDMPALKIPDGDSPLWKQYGDLKSLSIADHITSYLDDDYVRSITRMWAKFGDGTKTPLPTSVVVPQVEQVDLSSEAGGNYNVVAVQLKKAYETVQNTMSTITENVKVTADDLVKYQAVLGDDITGLSACASTLPGDDHDENTHILNYTATGLKQMETDLNALTDSLGLPAGKIKDQTKDLQDLNDKYDALNTKYQNLLDKYKGLSGASGPGASGSYNPPGLNPTNPTNPGTGASGSASTTDWNPPNLGSDLGGASGSTDPASSTATNPTGVGNSGGSSNDTGSQTTPAAATSPTSDMSSMLGPMMEMMQQQAMMRNLSDQNPNNQLNQPYPPGYQQQQPPAGPASTAPAQAAPAAPAQTPPQTAPNGPGTTAPPAAPPGRVPGADGLVDYTFPDGRVQKVSSVVANALDAAFGNQAGTDAQAAYSQGDKTPAKWTDPKQIGDRVDPSQLMTGDVATWDDNHTAIVIVWGSAQNAGAALSGASGSGGASGPDAGSGQDGSLEVIIDGQQKPFSPEISGKGGDFGTFAGFAHPHGIEATATNAGDGAHAVPMVGDPSGGQAMQHAATAPGS